MLLFFFLIFICLEKSFFHTSIFIDWVNGLSKKKCVFAIYSQAHISNSRGEGGNQINNTVKTRTSSLNIFSAWIFLLLLFIQNNLYLLKTSICLEKSCVHPSIFIDASMVSVKKMSACYIRKHVYLILLAWLIFAYFLNEN